MPVAVAAPEAAATGTCPACDELNAPSARFCRACGRELMPAGTATASDLVSPTAAAEEEEEEEQTRTEATRPPPPSAVAPGIASPWTTAPSSWRKGWRPSRPVGVAIAAVLVVAAAGSAYALTRPDDGGGTAQQPAAVPETVEPEPVPDEQAAVDPTATTPGDPAPPTASTTTTTPTTSAGQAGNTNPNTPTGVIRAHWTAISEGDYSEAYQLFSSHYRRRTSEYRWAGAEADFAPKIHINNVLYLRQLPGLQAFVLVDILTRDTGPKGDSSKCNRFAGKVRVIKENGDWRYWAIGPGATWGKRPGLSRSDARCQSLFS